jgi:hypothetical protein
MVTAGYDEGSAAAVECEPNTADSDRKISRRAEAALILFFIKDNSSFDRSPDGRDMICDVLRHESADTFSQPRIIQATGRPAPNRRRRRAGAVLVHLPTLAEFSTTILSLFMTASPSNHILDQIVQLAEELGVDLFFER